MIEIPDYTEEEKKIIFKEFSFPAVLSRIGMREEECVITEDALDAVIAYCRGTTGIRELEQAAEHLAANALYRIEAEGAVRVVYDKERALAVLG